MRFVRVLRVADDEPEQVNVCQIASFRDAGETEMAGHWQETVEIRLTCGNKLRVWGTMPDLERQLQALGVLISVTEDD